MLLFQLISYLNKCKTPIPVAQLLSELSLIDSQLEAYSFYIEHHDGMVSLSQSAMNYIHWLTPHIIFHRNTQQISFDRSILPIEADVVRGLKPLWQEQGLLVEKVEFLLELEAMLASPVPVDMKIIYSPAKWDAKARQLSFFQFGKESHDIAHELSTLQANDEWETWHYYCQQVRSGFYSYTPRKIQKMIDLLQEQYGFTGLLYQLYSGGKISTFVPYSTRYSIYIVDTPEGEKYFGYPRRKKLQDMLTIHAENNSTPIQVIGFLPHFKELNIAHKPSPVSVVDSSSKTSKEEKPLWMLLSKEKRVWVCETEGGRFSMRQLITSATARERLTTFLNALSTPNDFLLEKRDSSTMTFFSSPKTGRKTVSFAEETFLFAAAEIVDPQLEEINPDEFDDLDGPNYGGISF